VGAPGYSNGAAYADLDKDGDLDLIINNINGPVGLLKNMESKGHHISIKVNGAKNAQISVYSKNHTQTKEYTTTRGYQSSSTHWVHFGLSTGYTIDSIIIKSPTAESVILKEVTPDQFLEIDIDKNEKTPISTPTLTTKWNLHKLDIIHTENEYNDLDFEVLMPYRLSREGPASLVEDFDNDGIKDLLLGGASQSPTQLFTGNKNGLFQKKMIKVFDLDSRYEDIDAESFDFNQDGYLDLYIVSGGNEYNELNESIQDRIYINDGTGDFYRLDLSLPHTNGSCIRISDFDNDGFDDLFIGAQNIPGAFGLSPVSFLLKNVKGQRLEMVARLRDGMIGDADWVDMTGDSLPELVIAPQWAPIKIYQIMDDTTLVDIREDLGIPDLRGLYNKILVEDINDDGHQDLILGNLGHNTQWQIQNNQDIRMYLGDFDDNSYIDPIIFYNYSEEKIPFSDKTILMSQLPVVSKIFPSFQSFSAFRDIGQLQDATSGEVLQDLWINNLASGVVMSQSNSSYDFVPFPHEVQVSNINDFHWIDKGPLKGSLMYVGNSKSQSHRMGQNLGSRGGILTSLDSKYHTFNKHHSLSLPIGHVSKRIHPLSKTKFIVINNDDDQFIMKYNE